MKLTKTVFISRDLQADSPIKILEQYGYKVFGESLIHFSPLDFQLGEWADWVFFYSKNAVRYFLDHAEGAHYIKDKKVATIGSQTAAYLDHNYNIISNFIGDGSVNEIAKAFKTTLADQKVLFTRSKHSRKSIQVYLDPRQVIERICYDNEIKKKVDIPRVNIATLTSPMNAEAFLEHYSYYIETLKVIAIGKTTREYLINRSICDEILMPVKPSEKAMADLILSNKLV